MDTSGRVRDCRKTLYTIGHSTRELGEFLAILVSYGIRRLIDVRTVPRSRRNPQFNKESLPRELKKAGIRYSHLKELGGLRRAKQDSANDGWRNASFRGFADHMQTVEFEKGMKELLAHIQEETVCIMCAESLPWRCHRSLIADAVAVRGYCVMHIMGSSSLRAHVLHTFARVQDGTISYPAAVHQDPASLKKSPSEGTMNTR